MGTTYPGRDSGNGVIYERKRTPGGKRKESVFLGFTFLGRILLTDNPVTFDAAGNLFVATREAGGEHIGYEGYDGGLETAPWINGSTDIIPNGFARCLTVRSQSRFVDCL